MDGDDNDATYDDDDYHCDGDDHDDDDDNGDDDNDDGDDGGDDDDDDDDDDSDDDGDDGDNNDHVFSENVLTFCICLFQLTRVGCCSQNMYIGQLELVFNVRDHQGHAASTRRP